MNKRPLQLFMECKSRQTSRKNSRVYDILNQTMNKENETPQMSKTNTIKKIDRTIGSINKMYQQAISDHQNIHEQACMLKEDLNGKLLQRAELIAQYEELEELIEFHRKQSQFEFDFAKKVERLDQQIQSQKRFKLTPTTADLIRDREQAHKQLKDKIEVEAQRAYAQYIIDHKPSFDTIRAQYGDQQCQTIKQQQRQQILAILSTQYSKKIQGIINLLRSYEKVEQAIQTNVQYVDGSLTQDLYNIHQAIQSKQRLLSEMQLNITDQPLLQRVQHLEEENHILEQQLCEMTMRMDLQQQQILNQQKAEEIYNQILTDSIASPTKSQNSRKKAPLRGTKQDDSLHFSQFIDSCINADTEKESSACQLSEDDSLLQHFNELNQSIVQCERKAKPLIQLPLQRTERSQIVENLQKDLLRLQTISEEQQSTKRENQKQIEESKLSRLNFNKTKTLENTISQQSTDQSKYFNKSQQRIQVNQIQQPQFFNSTASNPTSIKSISKPMVFRVREQTLSEQIMKHKKSKSFDSTREAQQSKRLFSTNKGANVEGPPAQIQAQQQGQRPFIPLELEILKVIKPLLNGVQVQKRFTNKPNLFRQEFDPLSSANPTVCGYGQRLLTLSSSLDRIEFRNQLKLNQIDSQVQLSQIIRVVVSKQICQFMSAKRKLGERLILTAEEKAILGIKYWPLSIITQNDGRIELLFDTEDLMEQWQIGLVFLKDNLKTLQHIAKKMKYP